IAVLDAASIYDDLVCALMFRNAMLENSKERPTFTPPQTVAHAPSAARLAVPPMKKPVETWSAIVTSSDPTVSGKQVADKVRSEVAPALGVRVHEVRELKRGGAVIRTPSASDLRKVENKRKFTEVGLEVEPNRGSRSRITVFDVDTAISPENFMQKLYENHFKEGFSPAAFQKMVHLESKPWSVTEGARVNLTLECDEKAQAELENTGREDWLHVLCVCPLYADLRDLDGLGVRNLHGGWNVSGAVQTPERMRLLCAFAGAVFTGR
ncbi:hypothetical protein KR222_000701, partial [Zaprionus bogoriensis]